MSLAAIEFLNWHGLNSNKPFPKQLEQSTWTGGQDKLHQIETKTPTQQITPNLYHAAIILYCTLLL